jgi:hypothetical protein
VDEDQRTLGTFEAGRKFRNPLRPNKKKMSPRRTRPLVGQRRLSFLRLARSWMTS